MNRTFRLRRSILIQGIGFLLIYLTVTIGGAVVLLLIKEPQKQGFKDAESVKIMFGMWVSVFGTMTVLSVYMLIAYCMEAPVNQRPEDSCQVRVSESALRIDRGRQARLENNA